MEKRYLDCFVESVSFAFSMFLGSDRQCKIKSVDILQAIPRDANMHVFIGITGDLFGIGMFSFAGANSLALASAMCGMELNEHNEISMSALKEILNISAGGAATRLAELGRIVDVTPPTVVSGDAIEVQTSLPLVSISFAAGDIPFRLSASIKEKHRHRVLVVDDSALMLTVATDLLQANGFDVAGTCETGDECLDFLEKDVPDIVLLDINMPGTNGLEVLRSIKERKLKTKVVIMTGMGDPKTVQRATALGTDGFVVKPIDNNLISIMKHL